MSKTALKKAEAKANELGNLLLRALPTLDDEVLRNNIIANENEGWIGVVEAFRNQANEARAALVKHGFLTK